MLAHGRGRWVVSQKRLMMRGELFTFAAFGVRIWVHPGPIGRKKLQPRNYFHIFYSFELKHCGMVELCIQKLKLNNSLTSGVFFTFYSITASLSLTIIKLRVPGVESSHEYKTWKYTKRKTRLSVIMFAFLTDKTESDPEWSVVIT